MDVNRIRCLNDAGWIPLVAVVTVEGEVVRFYWCHFCSELISTLGASRKDVAGFAVDKIGMGWKLYRRIGTEAEVRLAVLAAEGIPTSF